MEYNLNRICVDVFIDHWQQIIYAINQKDDASSAETIFKHVDILVSIIIKECDEEQLSLEDILQYCDSNSIFQTIFINFSRDNLKGEIKEYGMYYQLRMYDNILNFLPCNCLMRHQILSPLLKLLEDCSLRQSVKIEHLSVRLLYQLTVLITRDSTLFLFLKDISKRDFNEPMFFISLIILLIHRDKDIGRLSQEALLLILNYSKDEDCDIVDYICYRSDFAAILATGLSGMYSSFPRKLENLSEDWQQLTVDYILSVPELKQSLKLLDFCNLTLKMAHPKIQNDILEYLYTGFLSPVIGPSLHQNSLEETISATAYLELFLRHLHHPSLTKLFLQFILLEKQDSYVVLDSLINRLNSLTMNDTVEGMYTLGIVTLSLFRTILSFHCEDVMFHLILKYLIPCDHLIKQKWAQISNDSSTEDLSQCTTMFRSHRRVLEHYPNIESPINEDMSNSAEYFLRLSFGTHSDNESICNNNLIKKTNQMNAELRRASQSPAILNHLQKFSGISPYYSYLQAASVYVNRKILASNSWTMNYDGVNPPPQIFELLGNYNDRWREKFPFSLNIKRSDETIHDNDDRDNVEESSPNYLDSVKVRDVGYYSSNNGSGSNISHKVVGPTRLSQSSEENHTTVRRLCDPSPSSKAIYKLNYFSFDPQLPEIEGTDDLSVVRPDEEQLQLYDSDDKFENINMTNVLLSTPEDCPFLDFLVSLDLLEIDDDIDWDIDWNDIYDLLTEHNSNSDQYPRKYSLTTVSSEDSVPEQDFSQSTSTPTNEVIFKQRLQSFDQSIYLSPSHSNFPLTLGPFMTALFQRFRALPTNTVFMNLLITGIITDLASYPHPLLKSLILDIDIILQPQISKICEIVVEVKESLINQSNLIPSWESVLLNAYEYLYSRIETPSTTYNSPSFSEEEFDVRLFSASLSRSINSTVFDFDRSSSRQRLSISSSPIVKDKKSRKMSFGLLTRKKQKEELPNYKFPVHKFCYSKKKPVTEIEAQLVRNLAYSWVIFDEFCKELASLCQEHTLHCFF